MTSQKKKKINHSFFFLIAKFKYIFPLYVYIYVHIYGVYGVANQQFSGQRQHETECRRDSSLGTRVRLANGPGT